MNMSAVRSLFLPILVNIALLSLLLCAAGIQNQLQPLTDTGLPLLGFFNALPGVFIGVSLFCVIYNQALLARLLGVLLITYTAVLWFVDLQLITPQFIRPPTIMLVNLFLVALYFSLYRLRVLGSILAYCAGVFGVYVGLKALFNIWLTNHQLTSSSNIFELSVFALVIFLVAVAIILIQLFSQPRTRKLGYTAVCSALMVQGVGVGLWVYLTHAHVGDLQELGNLSIKQTGQSIDKLIAFDQQLLRRYTERVANTSPTQRAEVIALEANNILDDTHHIDAISYVENGNVVWHSYSKAQRSYDHLKSKAYQQWLSNTQGNYKLMVEPNGPHPTVILLGRHEALGKSASLLFHLDTSVFMADIENHYFDFFTKIVQIGPSNYVSENSSEIDSARSQWLIEHSSFWVKKTYPSDIGYPITLYAVLTRPGSLVGAARTHQLVLLSSFVFSVVLTIALRSNYRLRTMAQQDNITRLLQRQYLEDLMKKSFNHPACSGWILFIDLDGFKPINDSLGLDIGNEVLRVIAKRLTQSTTANAKLARFSSDEFILFIDTTRSTDVFLNDDVAITTLCQSLLDTVRKKIVIDGFTLYLTASIGVYKIKECSRDPSNAIRCADVAMSAAKEFGGNTYFFYTNEMAEEYQRTLSIRSELQEALDTGNIDVYYQPIVEVGSGRIVSVEALARWRKTDGTFVSPSQFIPLAEQTGQIKQLTHLVFQKAMNELCPLIRLHDFSLSLNFSLHQFHLANIIEQLTALSSESSLPLNRLCIEITESILISDVNLIHEQLTQLREKGVKVAIDDFGTGYSSLSYLHLLPFDHLKIDRSFTAQVDGSRNAYPLVSAIIMLAKSVDKQIVVEGIETRYQSDFFKSENCQYFQGFGYAKPLPIEQLTILLNNNVNGLSGPSA